MLEERHKHASSSPAVEDIQQKLRAWASRLREVADSERHPHRRDYIVRGSDLSHLESLAVRARNAIYHADKLVKFDDMDEYNRRRFESLVEHGVIPANPEDMESCADLLDMGARAVRPALLESSGGDDLSSCDLWLTQATSPWWWASRSVKLVVLGVVAMWRRGWFATIWMTAASAGIGCGVFRLVQLGGLDAKLAWAPGVAAFFAFPAFWEKVKPAK